MTERPRRQVVYLGVGVINTFLDFGFYTLLTLTILKGEGNIALAGIISGTFALACAFTTHSLITWRGSHVSTSTILKFIAFTGFGMWVIRPSLLAVFIHLSSFYGAVHTVSKALALPFSYEFIAHTGAFMLMVVIVLVYNFYVYDRFVFTKHRSTHIDPESH